ncbi:vasoactive intestinal polypeptide receptor 2 [Leptonychotes weddellii]|uniref:Vasoactive intestinal polypeptide receptor 2 n=1 Tax=Leptonychotes weddellii TaxID=9713 RepID=A0A7F8QLK5_LEPWE|nr:vasoactive intestinal polypeptide receptor 2 [Leptonychotes weddellii]
MRAPALLTCCGWLLAPVTSVHPECRFHLEIQEEETKCAELLRTQTEKYKACTGVWDNITCWRPADIGETVTVPCPKVFSNFYSKPGNISKNCTSDGWSEMFPDFVDACGYNDAEDESKITFYILVKAIYTLGYSVSLISLTTGSIILCLFRKLHCTRNYIHLNLFLSFILRAISVLVKDDVLYSSSGTLHCPDQPSSWVRLSLAPAGGLVGALLRSHGLPGGTQRPSLCCRRLAKSTLLLIPLFGVHYVVFAVFPIGISSKYQILFELCIGSFQGLVVAVLYCFLNSEVQSELKRKWRSLCRSRPCGRDCRLHSLSVWRNGSESAQQFHRGSRAPSFLQTETSVI